MRSVVLSPVQRLGHHAFSGRQGFVLQASPTLRLYGLVDLALEVTHRLIFALRTSKNHKPNQNG